MADTNDNITKLYKALSKEGFNDIGTADEFRNYVSTPENVGTLHKALEKAGYNDIGTADEFSEWLSEGAAPAQPPQQESAPVTQEAAEQQDTVPSKEAQRAQSVGGSEWRQRTVEAIQPRGSRGARNPYAGKTYGEVLDEVTAQYGDNLGRKDVADPYSEARAQIMQAGITDDLKPEEADALALSIREKYAEKYAKGTARGIVDSLPDQVPDIDGILDGAWYSRQLQQTMAANARRLGLRQDLYLNYYVKPQIAKALSDRYGYDRQSAQHIAGRLFSHGEHIEERMNRNEANDLVARYAAPQIQAYFDESRTEAAQMFSDRDKPSPYADPGLDFGASNTLIKAWQHTDPEKIWKRMEPQLNVITGRITGDEQFWKDAEAKADAEGTDIVTYMNQRIKPVLEAVVQSEFERMAVEAEMPENAFEYVFAKMSESLVGTLMKGALASEARRRAMQQAMGQTEAGRGKYQPGMGARIAGGTAAMVPDLPLFGIIGKATAPVVTGMTQGLLAEGVRPLVSRMAGASLGGGLTMGGVEAAKGGIEGGMDARDYGGLLEENDRSVGEVLRDITKGAAERGAPSFVSGLGMVGGPIGQKISGGRGIVGNLLGWGAQTGIDAAAATGISVISGEVKPDDMGEHFLENVGTFAAIGLHGKAKEFRELADGGRSWNGVTFSRKEIEQLEGRYLVPLRRLITETEKANNRRGLIGQAIDGREADERQREAMQSAGAEIYGDLMRSYAVDRAVKVKVAQALGTPLPDFVLQPDVLRLHGEVPERSVDLGMVDVLNYEHNREGGIADKMRAGKPLSGDELTIRLLFQDNKAFNEAVRKEQSGEPLTEQEQELLDVNRERFASVQRGYLRREQERIASEFEGEHGLEKGAVARMLKDVAQGKAVDNNLMNDYEALLRDYEQRFNDIEAARELDNAEAGKPVTDQGGVSKPAATPAPETGNDGSGENAPVPQAPKPEEKPQSTDTQGEGKKQADASLLAHEDGSIVEVTLTDGSTAYVTSGDPMNEYGRVTLVDGSGQPVTVKDGKGYVIDRVPTSLIARDASGNPQVKPAMTVGEWLGSQQEEDIPAAGPRAAAEGKSSSSRSQEALSRIPVVDGKMHWEGAPAEDSRAAFTEKYGEGKAREMAVRLAENNRAVLEELSRKDTSEMTDPDALMAHEDALAEAERRARYWQEVADGFTEKPAPAAETPEEPETPPAAPVAPARPATPATPPRQEPTAEQKAAMGSVKNNIGRTLGYTYDGGQRTEIRLDRFTGDGRIEVTRTDYDAQGNPTGEPVKQTLDTTEVGNSIIQGVMKPVLSTEERLREAYKGRIGMQNIIDVLTEPEMERMLAAHEKGDTEALREMQQEFTESHREDIILNGRDRRNQSVDSILAGGFGVGEKLRRIRKQYQGYDDAEVALSDESLKPSTLEEYVADLHSSVPKKGEGPLAYFSYDKGDGHKVVGMQDETGDGTKSGGDTKGYAPWLAPKGKGMSLQKYAETIHSQLPEAVQEQYSDQDVRNAILEVFGGAERPSDIPTMIIRRGIIQAEQAARRMEEAWIDGMSYQKKPKVFAERLRQGVEATAKEPTDGQKEAGNYAKGHVTFGGYHFTIENPAGSVRRGTDADGRQWEQRMNNTYGYILGRYGKDGDHLDMFINDKADLDEWNGNVYVVDQVNKDGTFDEHKVLYGFDSEAEAREAYLSNYEEGWQGLGKITGVSKETFDKWLDSSKRKVKPFAEHSIAKEAEKKRIQGLDGYTKDEVLDAVRGDIDRLLEENGLDGVEIKGMDIHGSRMRGDAREDSDLDVVVEYDGDISEDGLFNILNENPITIEGVKVDINPITRGKSGTLEEYMKRSAEYDQKKSQEAAHKVEAEPASPVGDQEKALRDAVVEHLRSKGIEVSDDWELGQRILDEYNSGGQVKKMGSRTEAKKRQIASDLSGRSLTEEQQSVVDVFTGSKDRQRIEIGREDGSNVSLVLRQGNDNRAGTKHASFRHYDVNGDDYFTSDDILLIPEVVRTGERNEEGKRVKYSAVIDGVEYTVATEMKNGTENFVTFYTNRKKQDRQSRRTQSEDAQPLSDDALSGTKVQQNTETAKDFEEKQLKFFKTPDGEAYGYTYKGKIYLDPRIATSETPIHEYGHLWAEMKRRTAPEEWADIRRTLLGDRLVQPFIDKVRDEYPELSGKGREDDFVEEVLTQFSGRHGAERLRKVAEDIMHEHGGDLTARMLAEAAVRRVKSVLDRFWKSVAGMMGWHYTSAEDIADRMLKDMLDGVNPVERMKDASGAGQVKEAKVVRMNAETVKMPGKQIEDMYTEGLKPGDALNMQDRVLNMSPKELIEQYRRLNGEMLDENGLDIDEQEEKFRQEWRDKHGWPPAVGSEFGKASADFMKSLADKYTYNKMALRWDVLDRIRDLGLEDYLEKDAGTLPDKDTAEYIRMQLVGKKGAAEADKSEGGSVRMENNRIAEEMEKAGKDAKAIKLATGWERGKDGQWRYETVDADRDILGIYDKELKKVDEEYRAKKKELDTLTAEWNRQADELLAQVEPGGDGGMSREEYNKALEPIASKVKDKRKEVDHLMRLREGYSPIVRLGDLLGEDNELFRYYPKMKDMQVMFDGNMQDGVAGIFDGSNISLNAKESGMFGDRMLDNENIYGTLLHEVQHAVQDAEGFAKGGNLHTATTEEGLLAVIHRKSVERSKVMRELDSLNRILASSEEEMKMWAELEGKTPEEERRAVQERIERKAAEYDNLTAQMNRIEKLKTVSMTDARNLYHDLAGEVEARNATKRMGMTEEERRAKPASETEDVDREDQVVIMGDGTSMSINDIKPVGTGDFGDIYDQFKGKPKEAVDFLMKKRSGDLKGVFNREEVGDVDLVWGNGKAGWYHIILKHVVNYGDFNSVDEAIDIVTDTMNNGKYTIQDDGRVAYVKGNYRVAIEKKDDGNWIVTALDQSRKKKEKKRSEQDATLLHQSIFGEENGELVSRQPALSGGKDTKNIVTSQENSEENLPSDAMEADFPRFSKVRKPTNNQMHAQRDKQMEQRRREQAKRAAAEAGIREPQEQVFIREAEERFKADHKAWEEGGRQGREPIAWDYDGSSDYRRAMEEYERKVEPYMPEGSAELSKDDMIIERESQVRTPAQKIVNGVIETLAREGDAVQASDAVREGVMERRRNIEELSADDSLYINDIREQTERIAKELSGDRWDGEDAFSRLMNEVERRKDGVFGREHMTGRDIREALPYLIEAPMRRNDIAHGINDELSRKSSPVTLTGEDLRAAGKEIAAMREGAARLLEINRQMADEERTQMTAEEQTVYDGVKQQAQAVADALNAARERGDNPVRADDVLAALSHFVKRVVPDGLKVTEDMPELRHILNGIRDWYAAAYGWLEEAGMRPDHVGYYKDYVNHVWDAKKSDAEAYDRLVANRQPTTSRNMKNREVRTYMEGIEAGLVPQFSEVTDMMGDYSKKNILSWANKKMLKDLSFIDVVERNDEGEVTGIFPMMSSTAPDLYGLDKYQYYEVPGVGPLWVYKEAAGNFSQVFEQYEVGGMMKAYDNMASLAKKIELSWSGFHAGALSEVYAVQNSIEFGPAKTARMFYKYLVKDCLETGLSPAYANPDDYRSAARHFVKLGATDDYSAPAVQNMSETMVDFISGMRKALEARGIAGKAAGRGVIGPAEVLATAVKMINEGSDKVLWTWLHDGLKIATFRMMEDRTRSAMERRFRKEMPGRPWEEIEQSEEYQKALDEQLDRDGQYVNDMFGGQHWELIQVSPKTLRYMRRFLLSPDWLISTQRHFLGAFGFGDIHSKARLRDFGKFLQAVKGEQADFDENSLPGLYAGLIGKGANRAGIHGRDLDQWAEMNLPQGRMRRVLSSVLCYAVGVNIMYDIVNNTVNAVMRRLDEEAELEKEKEQEGYVSEYRLMYPDGMKWFDRRRLDWNPMHMFGVANMVFGDYGMAGNALGKKTHVFGGHYGEGAEIYLRTGKQFKEFPDFWENEKGEMEFPRPLVNRLMGKANPNIRMLYNTLNYYTRWDKSYDDEQLEERIKKFTENKTVVGLGVGLTKLADNYKPFWVPTQEGKDWVASDLVFPSSKGFGAHKARTYFEQFMKAGDDEGYMETVRACVLNGMTDEQISRAIKSAENGIAAEQRKRASEGAETLQDMIGSFNAADGLAERRAIYRKIRTELGNEQPKAPRDYDSFMEQLSRWHDGTEQAATKAAERYMERATGMDMVEEARVEFLRKEIRAVTDELRAMERDGATQEEMAAFRKRPENARLLKAAETVKGYMNGEGGISAIKAMLGKEPVTAGGKRHDDKWRMQKIRSMRKAMLEKVDRLE